MKMKIPSILIPIVFSIPIFSQSPVVDFDNGIVYIKNFNIKFIDTVFNNKTYRFPANWEITKGSDNTLIAYPQSWKIMEGRDGHPVAFPSTWIYEQSPDGRIVAYPFEEITIKTRKKINNCTEQDTSKCYETVTETINKYGIYTQTGKDNRKVRYTKSMILAQGQDGRLVNLPKNWEISQSQTGRLTAYPKNWAAYEIGDKQFAMPQNWEIDFETDTPKILQEKDFIKFIFTPVEKIELAKQIYEQDKTNGLDYLIYMLTQY